ncbi:MAG: efflux RND transporter permease subunit [Phycisphaerales bacterium]|nr:efflux RND transporter permease subunit [Phycisphaerales bacterium]
MDIVKLAIAKPVGVTVGVILVVMFGLIGLGEIPIQLTPTVDRPVVTITTAWPGRSPQEIIDEITREQEERLKNVSNLRTMRSITREGSAEVTLEFYIGTDINRALQEVSDRLRQVPSSPPDANEPTIKAAEGDAENAIAWIILDLDPAVEERFPDFDISILFDPVEKRVKPFLERIDGVAEVNVYGGRARELRVQLDPTLMAQRSLTYDDIAAALRAENINISAGAIAEGKRDVRVRVVGQFESPDEVLETVVAYRDGRPVFVKDIGEVELGYEKRRGFVRSLGTPALAINVIRQSGANVVDVMDDLRDRLDEVREDFLPGIHREVGPHLRLRQVYDETIYIDSAINLVTTNLIIGGTLAAIVLLVFLRSFVTTGVIVMSIPISIIATFLVMLAFGRTLNVISLAGLAFAVGMVVDNAIVVLENIFRKRQEGMAPMEAAYKGGREVWGAVLASTLTTIAVFIPVLTIQEEAGQLFRDISLAVVAAVSLSLIVSITVIPAALSRWLPAVRTPGEHAGGRFGPIRDRFESLFGLAPFLSRMSDKVTVLAIWVMRSWRGWTIRPAIVVVLMLVSVIGALRLMPPLDYLPAGNRNLVFGGLLIPPGYSIDQQLDIARRIEREIKPYAEARVDDPASVAALPPIHRFGDPPPPPFDPVPVDNFFIGAFQGGMFIGATSQIDQVVIPVGQLLTLSMSGIPDAFGGARQTSIFGMGAGGGNTIDVQISGPELDRVRDAANFIFNELAGRYGYDRVRPDPANFNLQQQELQVRLNNHGRRLGLRTSDVGVAIRALFDGAFVDDYRYSGENIDLLLVPKGDRLDYKEQLADIQITTPAGRVVPVDAVASLLPALAPQEIQRIEELPSVTVRVTPPDGAALEVIEAEIISGAIAGAREAGLLDRSMRVHLDGTAAKLDEVRNALFGKPRSARDSGLPIVSRLIIAASAVLAIVGLALAGLGVFRTVRRKDASFAYGGAGAILLFFVLAILGFLVATQPQLATARFVWALLVTYLLMSALFESFIYPFVIMFSVPLAVVGGFVGLKIVHETSMRNPTLAPQQLDVLTMLGFFILIGVVVNNAILIVHQSLNFMRDGESDEKRAIALAVNSRIRPIFMSVLTSVGGMLPLVLMPGAGSEMYRGLGSVVVGGLLCAAFFTLILVPMLFSLVLDMGHGLRRLLGRPYKPIVTPNHAPKA